MSQRATLIVDLAREVHARVGVCLGEVPPHDKIRTLGLVVEVLGKMLFTFNLDDELIPRLRKLATCAAEARTLHELHGALITAHRLTEDFLAAAEAWADRG